MNKRNIRFLSFSDPKTFGDNKFTIHKLCFGNFMYSYFQKRYRLKSIVLLRHPFAVAASSLKFGNNFDYHKQNYGVWRYEDSEKSGTFFKSFESKYDLIVSAFTLLVFQTISQFSFVIDNLDKDNTLIIFYEDLVVEKKSTFSALEKFLEMSINYKQFESLLGKQSFSSSSGHTEDDSIAQL
ncbi:MAG: sulfotransferase domain-containing protein [Gelidibacter sp.]